MKPYPTSLPSSSAHAAFAAYVADPTFPCVGARSALNRDRYRFHELEALGTTAAAASLCTALYEFQAEFPEPGLDPVTFIAAFDRGGETEAEFESLLWKQLQLLHEVDRRRFAWDETVSSDPSSSQFSFSIGGRGLFVVGLHPNASRLARRAPMPTLVFNLHQQFEDLRASGRYASLQKAIRKRDVALQGTINPVLAQFGDASEALQYAGRARTSEWKCPFQQGVAHAASR